MAKTLEERLEELERLHAESGKLLEQLPRSIRIKEVWPEAFAHNCSCSPILTGTTYPWGTVSFMRKYPNPYDRVREIHRTFLRRSDNVEKDISVKDFFYILTGEYNDWKV